MEIAALDERLRRWRRRLIVGAIAVVAALVVVVELITAAKLALEPLVGRPEARLIVAGAIVLAVALLFGWVAYAERRDRATGDRAEQDARANAIAEALSLGFSLGRGVRRSRSAARKSRAKPSEKESEEAREPESA